MDTRPSLTPAPRMALGLALLAASCTSDAPDRASDASSVGSSYDGHSGRYDGGAGDSASDSSGRASDASSVGSPCDGHSGRCDGGAGNGEIDAGAADSAIDAGAGCTDLVQTPHGAIPRECIYSIPPGATLDWPATPFPPVRVLSMDGGLLATYETYAGCECKSLMGIELIPAGADPRTWQLVDASIHASDYDRSCHQDADCISVVESDLSSPCFCPNASIASSAAAVYQADLVRKRQGGIFGALCSCPAYGFPACHEGQCSTSL